MRSSQGGFTLIELTIVVAIVAIIAAIAIPNLIQSRLRANEASAVSVIKQIASAQVQWQVGRLSRRNDNSAGSDNSYADNYRNLHYGELVMGGSQPIGLISKAVADADTGVVIGSPLNPNTGGAVTVGDAYQGYHFIEPTGALTADFDTTFAIVAVPNHSSRSGTSSYYLGEDGTVYSKGLGHGLQVGTAANLAVMRGATHIMNPSYTAAFLADGFKAF